MSRSFYHYLYIFLPCTFCKFSKANQFFNLAYIGTICKAAWTAGITKRNRYIVFLTDIKNFIEIFIERVFFSCHCHPCKYKGTSTGYDVHFSFMLFNLVDCLSCNSTV